MMQEAGKKGSNKSVGISHNAYAHALAHCYVQADRDRLEDRARKLLA